MWSAKGNGKMDAGRKEKGKAKGNATGKASRNVSDNAHAVVKTLGDV